jgi:hypothetical protein
MKTPGSWTVEGFFEGRPAALALFNTVRKYIESFGAVTIEPMKTQIAFGAKRKFAWVWLPQTWIKKRLENSLTLTFDLNHKVENPRIEEAVEPQPGRWTHHVIIEKQSDLDDEVKGWLREAYENSVSRGE